MVTIITPLFLYLINKQIQSLYINVLDQMIIEFYIIMFSKHHSNVYVVDYIMQVVDYGIMNLVESPRYDLGCERSLVILSWNYSVPTHYMPIIKRVTWALPSHALLFKKV